MVIRVARVWHRVGKYNRSGIILRCLDIILRCGILIAAAAGLKVRAAAFANLESGWIL